MTKRATVTISIDVDETRLSTDADDAKEDIEQRLSETAREIGDIKRISVALTGWPRSESRSFY